jgi:hypothetical protein
MTERRIKVEFEEQSKSVVATIQVEVSGTDVDSDAVYKEACALFDKAFTYARGKTAGKLL